MVLRRCRVLLGNEDLALDAMHDVLACHRDPLVLAHLASKLHGFLEKAQVPTTRMLGHDSSALGELCAARHRAALAPPKLTPAE